MILSSSSMALLTGASSLRRLSVSSSSKRPGAIPVSSTMRESLLARLSPLNWRGERFTATRRGGKPSLSLAPLRVVPREQGTTHGPVLVVEQLDPVARPAASPTRSS